MGQESWMLAIGVRDRQPVSRRHRERHSGYLQRLLPSAVRSYQSTHRRFIWLGFQLQGGLLRSNRLETTRTAAGYAANCVLHGAHDVDSIDEDEPVGSLIPAYPSYQNSHRSPPLPTLSFLSVADAGSLTACSFVHASVLQPLLASLLSRMVALWNTSLCSLLGLSICTYTH